MDPGAGICLRYLARQIVGEAVDPEEREGTLIGRLLRQESCCSEEVRGSCGGVLCDLLDLEVVGHEVLDRLRTGILDCLEEEGMQDHGLA